MPQYDIMNLVLHEFAVSSSMDLNALIETIQCNHADLSKNEIRSAILGLLRRQELKLTPNFQIELPNQETVAA